MSLPASHSQAKAPTVWLPGLLNDGRLFASQIAALSAKGVQSQTITLDFESSVIGLAQGVITRAPAQFSLAALSMGGYVAFEVIRQLQAAGQMSRLHKLILMNTQARPDSDETRQQREALIKLAQIGRFKGVTPRLLPRLLGLEALGNEKITGLIMEMAGDIGRDGFVRQQQAILSRIDSRPLLPTITVPTLVIGGTEDKLTPPDAIAELGNAIPNATAHILVGCGHLSPLERADAVTPLVTDFLIK